ncbi:hypothetical protein JYB87_00960 [Shewanella avicenniae]|uniref:Uncharacterized protein n=1 Tax=Shewanella avicenniae TaxID=2814294 RepID=A0ABX7QQW6_9GAMM|nr:hypothetical protein [Shewanella avicenniae]QSX33856.1 hypothetical protein JYB87_00960 [Shewanella avicenniae]
MSFTKAVSQQWHKAEVAELMCKRLQLEPTITILMSGATSLQTVCNLVAAIAFAEQDWMADDWDDEQLVAMFFCAFQLLFAKAIQQPLAQGEELILSVGGRLAQCLNSDEFEEVSHRLMSLMKLSSDRLIELRCQQRRTHRNMC